MPWPWFNAWCGDIDVCGFKKPQSFYRDVVWRRSQIEMMVHTPIPEGSRERVSGWGWPDEAQLELAGTGRQAVAGRGLFALRHACGWN